MCSKWHCELCAGLPLVRTFDLEHLYYCYYLNSADFI